MVFQKMIPKDQRFFEILQSHAGKTSEAVAIFIELVQQPERLAEVAQRIKTLENEADNLTHQMVTMLNTTFVTPLDREDLHALISAMDDVMDHLDATAQRLYFYRCEAGTPLLVEMAEVLQKQMQEIEAALAALPHLRKGPKEMLQRCVEINRLENEGDRLLRQGLGDLFGSPNPDPLYVLKWKDIYENLEIAIDYGEDVANVLESIVLKYA